MLRDFAIRREIGIDAAHRVAQHGSKCRRLHGHRYTIEAVCSGPLQVMGEQQGMTLDFGFLKEEMMAEIDTPCDHATILHVKDPLLSLFIPSVLIEHQRDTVERYGCSGGIFEDEALGIEHKMYLIGDTPTAEVLARHWFNRLVPRVVERSEGLARLSQIVVHETPNCAAYYPF